MLSSTLPLKFIAVALIVVGVEFVVTKVVSEILPKVVGLPPSHISTVKLASAPLAPCFWNTAVTTKLLNVAPLSPLVSSM